MHLLTETWWRLFVNRTDGTLRRGMDGWIFTPTVLTKQEMHAALRLRQSLGVYAVNQQGNSRWLCLDADTGSGKAVLVEIARTLNPASTLVELSRRGAHLWWFCPPTPWQQVRAGGQSLLGDRADEIETFPKGAGRNGVRLPLTRHPETNQVYPVVDPATGELRQPRDLVDLRMESLPHLAMPATVTLARPPFENRPKDFVVLKADVERVTELRQYAPERAIGRCPFHDDRRPSLSLLGGFWRCWAGCGEGGLHAFRALVTHQGLEVRQHDLQTTQ